MQQEEKEFYQDQIKGLEDKVLELKRNIYDKEYTIQEL